MTKPTEEWRDFPKVRVLLTATNRMVDADDDIHNVDLYPEAVRARDKLRPEQAPHRIVEYAPRAAVDAMRAERDEARAGLQKDCEAAHLEAYETGLAEAYEQAAKVCDSEGALECASRIRALTAKGGVK